MLRAKPRVSVDESSLCHKHAVTMLAQPGHVDEQLKERLKSQKEENRNCLLKIVQIYPIFLTKALLFVRASKTRSQISSSSSFSELKMMKCFESGLKSLMTSIWAPNAQNETLQIMALKVQWGIASDIAESGYYSIMADRALVRATLNSW